MQKIAIALLIVLGLACPLQAAKKAKASGKGVVVVNIGDNNNISGNIKIIVNNYDGQAIETEERHPAPPSPKTKLVRRDHCYDYRRRHNQLVNHWLVGGL